MQRNMFTLLLAVLLLLSCSKNEEAIQKENFIRPNETAVNISAMIPGEARIRLSEELAGKIEILKDEAGKLISTRVKSMDEAILTMGITSIERTFPHAGKFEQRSRAEGLHLWYDIQFNTSTSLTKAGDELSSIDGIREIEYKPKIIRIKSKLVSVEKTSGLPAARTAAMPFDDPMLTDQWHYYNDGSKSGCLSGADINVFPAWKQYTTGKEDVIVAVVDGGIDYTHEDLAANMWHNPEQSGELVYGYNFASNGYRITPDDHGTHVAGTIAAVNNNGKGVCGIAGGDAAKGINGVKLMSCQIFDADNKSGDGAKAIKWSADHGAVISQNSWGYDEIDYTPSSLKAAVDYFIKYAGLDENGNQTGPMKGGIVIFAAGNEDASIGYPSEYEKILAVTSICGDYKRAYYSNYGPWTDIIAPGGDAKKGITILSTIPGNKYGKMQGTSMACPHVSGVAALIVSYKGGAGFTNTALWDKLTRNVKDISQYNPGYYLGSGLVDAYAAIAGGSTIPPDNITDLSVSSVSNTIRFRLTVPADPDDGKAAGITLYYSRQPFTSGSEATARSFDTGNLSAGDILENEVTGLDFNTGYYVAAQAYDVAGNRSDLTALFEVTTKQNNAPVITPVNGLTASLKGHETKVLGFNLSDPDNHAMTMQFQPGSPAASAIMLDAGRVQVTLSGKDAPAGNYKAVLTITDAYGLSSNVEINYTILQNTPPEVIKPIENLVFGGIGQKSIFRLADHFKDEDGEILTYNTEFSAQGVCHINTDDENLYVVALSLGVTTVTLTATDALGQSCTMTFTVTVRNSAQEIDIYPNPVVDIMHIRTGQTGTAEITLINSAGSRVYEERVAISATAPLQIDMRSMSGGVYTVIIRLEGKEIKRNIVKL